VTEGQSQDKANNKLESDAWLKIRAMNLSYVFNFIDQDGEIEEALRKDLKNSKKKQQEQVQEATSSSGDSVEVCCSPPPSMSKKGLNFGLYKGIYL